MKNISLIILILNIYIPQFLYSQNLNTADTVEVRRIEVTDDYIIDNFNYSVRDDNTIYVIYDLIAHPEKGPFEISLEASVKISEDRYRVFKPEATIGDVGQNIQPGRGKTIVWHYLRDIPSGIDLDQLTLTIHIEEQKRKRGFPYMLVGVITATAIGAGSAYYFLTGNGGETELGEFPGRPE